MQGSDALLRQLAAANRITLRPSDAVAALLLHEDGRYIMQLRDAKDDIFYPAHWGCFGGAIEPGEDPAQALQRELKEEIEYEIQQASRFTQFDFDFSPFGGGKLCRVYFEVHVAASAFRRLVLHEGAGMKALAGGDLLAKHAVVPYDAFAVWMHMYRAKFAI
jgi:8-oxo-dGTP pyrophosphatase MutT (NUDIX family)